MPERKCLATGCVEGKVSWVEKGVVVTMNCVACNGTGTKTTSDPPKK